jgi:hypothetical protein
LTKEELCWHKAETDATMTSARMADVIKKELTLNPSLTKRGTLRIPCSILPFSSQEKGLGDEFV